MKDSKPFCGHIISGQEQSLDPSLHTHLTTAWPASYNQLCIFLPSVIEQVTYSGYQGRI
jgi:hypothetical protein